MRQKKRLEALKEAEKKRLKELKEAEKQKAEALQQQKIEMAKSMFDFAGLDTIVKVTGLSKEVLKKLKNG